MVVRDATDAHIVKRADDYDSNRVVFISLIRVIVFFSLVPLAGDTAPAHTLSPSPSILTLPIVVLCMLNRVHGAHDSCAREKRRVDHAASRGACDVLRDEGARERRRRKRKEAHASVLTRRARGVRRLRGVDGESTGNASAGLAWPMKRESTQLAALATLAITESTPCGG